MTHPLRIGTRGSQLALWQANHIAARLRPLAAPRPVELIEIETSGDRIQDVSLTQLGGQGIFTKEIQRALLDGRVDVAVHSLKDLPTVIFPGLTLAAVPERGPVRDAFVSLKHARFDALPPGAKVASSSQRRRSQLLSRRPDLNLVEIRGNVDTRLRKLAEQDLDAIILAEAGLVRLGLAERITECLDPTWMIPAVSQGALGLECRDDDATTRELLAQLSHGPTHAAVLAERSLLRSLGGGCQVPIGGYATLEGDTLTLHGIVLLPDGSDRVEGSVSGPVAEAETLGITLAREMLDRGAARILACAPALPPLSAPLSTVRVIGLPIREAGALCEAHGRPWRVIREDGEPQIVTADYVVGRWNLSTEQGRVVAVEVEGEGTNTA